MVSVANAHIEHISPKSKNFPFIFEAKNLCVICADCNTIKRAQEVIHEGIETIVRPDGRTRYPSSPNSFHIVHPHIDEYDEHIVKHGRIYVDKSTKGHFTIGCCKLNRFFHQFDVDDDFVDDEQLNQMMTNYLNSQSSLQRSSILQQLRDALINL